MHYPRNMVGYGEQTPKPNWPQKANIAVQFVINYEEGGENCILLKLIKDLRTGTIYFVD